MSVRDKGFCFLGNFDRDPKTVHYRLQRLGGVVVADVKDEAMDYLVLGAKAAKSKERAAKKRGVPILSMADLIKLLDASEAPAPAPKPKRRPSRYTPHDLMIALNGLDPRDPASLADTIELAKASGLVPDLDRSPTSGPAPAKVEPDEAPPWLFAWCSDADGCEFYVIPAAAIDERLSSDLLSVRGLCFAGGRDAAPHVLAAAIRLMARMGPATRGDAQAKARSLYDGWSHEFEGLDEAPIGGAGELEALMDCFAPFFVRHSEALKRPFTRIIAVNRAM